MASLLPLSPGASRPNRNCETWVNAHADATETATKRAIKLDELQQLHAEETLKTVELERELADARHERDALHLTIEQHKNEVRRSAFEEIHSKAQATAAQKDAQLVKDENSQLRKTKHQLEQELQELASAQSRLSQRLRETQESADLSISSLQQELEKAEARVQDALHQLLALRQGEASRDIHRKHIEEQLAERTKELDLATSDHVATKSECTEHMENLRKQLGDLMHQVQEEQCEDRAYRERLLAACQAQLEVSHARCRDEQRSGVLLMNHLEERRRGIVASDCARAQVARNFSELSDRVHVDRAQFAAELRNREGITDAMQERMRAELSEARLQGDALRELARTQEKQIQEVRGELARVERQKDDAESKHSVSTKDLAYRGALLEDARESLSTALAHKENASREFAAHKRAADADCDRDDRQHSLLSGELADAQRNAANVRDSLEASELRAATTEEKLRSAFDSNENHAMKAYAALQAEHGDLQSRIALYEQQHEDLHWQVKHHIGRYGQQQIVHAAEIDRLKQELAQERGHARAQAEADGQRLGDLERSNMRLQAQGDETARRLSALDSLHTGLREYVRESGRGVDIAA